jgi:DNA-directed RNA polymerase subunit RPC12/RpoP
MDSGILLKETIETLDDKEAPKVKVAIPKKQPSESFINDMKMVQKREGVNADPIFVKGCLDCGREVTNREIECPSCGGRRLKMKRIVPESTVKRIKGRVLAFQCPICLELYRFPVNCCVQKKALARGQVWEY